MASGGAGTLGLVHDLNIKLQKQSKTLRRLIKDVKSQDAAEWQWHAPCTPSCCIHRICPCGLMASKSF